MYVIENYRGEKSKCSFLRQMRHDTDFLNNLLVIIPVITWFKHASIYHWISFTKVKFEEI